MNHFFGVITDENIINILKNATNNQKMSVFEKIKLNFLISDYCPAKFNCISLKDEVFRQLNYTKFTSYFGNTIDKKEGFNYYGITIIPWSSLEIVYDSFSNLTKEEILRLKEINVNELEYYNMVSPILNLIKNAQKNKLYVIHFGI